MKAGLYKELYTLEDTYWWFIGKRLIAANLLKDILPKTRKCIILDAGCGTGENLRYFQRYGTTIGIDKSGEALRYCARRKSKNLVQGKIQTLPFRNSIFQIILALDLIEHLSDEEEVATLNEAHRILSSNGVLIITVPALPLLWSAHDRALGHYRRYTLKQLKEKLIKNGFRIKKISYFSSFILPATLISRFTKRPYLTQEKTDFPRVPPFINRVLIYLMKFESMLIKRVSLPIGSSLICIAKSKR